MSSPRPSRPDAESPQTPRTKNRSRTKNTAGFGGRPENGPIRQSSSSNPSVAHVNVQRNRKQGKRECKAVRKRHERERKKLRDHETVFFAGRRELNTRAGRSFGGGHKIPTRACRAPMKPGQMGKWVSGVSGPKLRNQDGRGERGKTSVNKRPMREESPSSSQAFLAAQLHHRTPIVRA